VAGNVVGYPLVAPSGVALMELRARQAGVVRLIFDLTTPTGSRRLRIEDAQGEHAFALGGSMHFDLNVEVPRGVSQLVLKTDPAPTSETDAVVMSQPRAEQPSGAGTADLRAIPASLDPGF
jgi:hypothetical protein